MATNRATDVEFVLTILALPERRTYRLAALKPIDIQPSRRHGKDNKRKLARAIQLLGTVLYPPVVTPSGIIADGHGRVEVMLELGIVEWECIVVPEDKARLVFILLNTSVETFTGRDWAEAIQYGLPIEMLFGNEGRKARDLYEIAGIDIFRVLTDNKLGIGIVTVVKEVATALVSDNKKAILSWLIRFDGQRRAREAAKNGGLDALREAIDGNVPLQSINGEWVAG